MLVRTAVQFLLYTGSPSPCRLLVPSLCSSPSISPLPPMAPSPFTPPNSLQVKGMKSPPAGVKLVLEAVCIMKNVKPVRGRGWCDW